MEEYFSVDWAFPPIDDNYRNEEDLLDEVSLSINTKYFVEESDVYHVFEESPKSEYLSWVLKKLFLLIFLGLAILYQVLLIKILMLVLLC